MLESSHDFPGVSVSFGSGTAPARVDDGLRRLGSGRVLLIADGFDDTAVNAIRSAVGQRMAAEVVDVVQHVPRPVVDAAVESARRVDADCVVTIGGGSSTGLGKAVVLETGIPLLAVPTTFAGSEATPIWGITTDGEKRTGRDEKVRPRIVVYDVDHYRALPPAVAASSALNALAHCFEALWVPHDDTYVNMFAVEGIRLIARGLAPEKAESEDDPLTSLLQGTYLAGYAFGRTGSGLHHTIAHVLGGRFNLQHADTHAALLPHVVDFNLSSLGPDGDRAADALGSAGIDEGLAALYDQLEAPSRLADVGLGESDLEEAVAAVQVALPIRNVRDVTPQSIEDLLRAAFHGGVVHA